jgi:hypothetical protein
METAAMQFDPLPASASEVHETVAFKSDARQEGTARGGARILRGDGCGAMKTPANGEIRCCFPGLRWRERIAAARRGPVAMTAS